MRTNNNKLLLISLSIFFTFIAKGQTSDSIPNKRPIHQVEFDIAPGYIFLSNDFYKGNNLKKEKIDKSLSLHLKYAFQFNPNSYLGKLYPHTYQGVGIAYNTFYNSNEVGNPIALYVFQGSRIKQLSQHLSFDYEWNFGASFGWKPYDENKNEYNTSIGSRINAYINLGFFLNWQMTSQWKLAAGVTATHYSNGNTHYPNGGLNTTGMRIGVTRLFDARYNKISMQHETMRIPLVKPHLSYDIIIYGATRSKGIVDEHYIVPSSFGIVGFNINPLYRFNKYLKAGLSLDGQYDESAHIENHIAGKNENGDMRFYRPPFIERIEAGLSLRGEFVMPIFSINIGIGHNILYKGSGYGGFYQVVALKTSITRNLFLHVGYQLSKFHDPKNLMLGFGYRLNN
ncbi:MAG: acyloxyacyl hydrolase [Parabacteroides sp.]|nr:acyloxyacyl hydrolase [Parabacteroides sp.]